MSNAAKVHEFLNKAQVFYFLTTDGDQPKGRPFGLQMLLDDAIYFGCGTFKNVFKQLTANPKVEVLALCGNEFMRYDGTVKIVKDGLGTLVAPTTGHYFVGGIDVTAGTLSMGGALAYGGTINAASGTTVSVPASVGSAGTSVINIAGGTLAVANCGTSVVTGTVTLGGNAISVAGSFAPVSGTAAHTITLADGATLDFTQWTGAFPVAYPTLAYAPDANIILKLESASTAIKDLARSKDATTGKPNGYLLSWDAIPTGVTFRPDAATDARFRVVPDENGLRVSFKGGFSIIIL